MSPAPAEKSPPPNVRSAADAVMAAPSDAAALEALARSIDRVEAKVERNGGNGGNGVRSLNLWQVLVGILMLLGGAAGGMLLDDRSDLAGVKTDLQGIKEGLVRIERKQDSHAKDGVHPNAATREEVAEVREAIREVASLTQGSIRQTAEVAQKNTENIASLVVISEGNRREIDRLRK